MSIFVRFAVKNETSTIKNSVHSGPSFHHATFHIARAERGEQDRVEEDRAGDIEAPPVPLLSRNGCDGLT